MFYVSYLVVLFHLPNYKFYLEMNHFDAVRLQHTARNIVMYAALEFVSLLYVHFFLRWQFNLSALHLLANVLERDYIVLQSVFMMWVMMVLQLTLQHAGTSNALIVVRYDTQLPTYIQCRP